MSEPLEKIPYTRENLEYLVETYYNDPRGFLEDLLGFTTFDPWQITLMEALVRGTRRIAIASANGTGKTYCLSALEIWWLLTHGDATISVCSATYTQLFDAHFRVIRHHLTKSIIPDYFDTSNSGKIRLANSGDAAYIAAISNNRTRPEAIAGRHHGSLLTIFDEASGIFQELYDSQEGNMTTEDSTWICIGNPLKSGTAFHHLFGQSDWECMHIDARRCMWTSKEWIDRMIATYGEDDDRVRARVFGEFPKGSVNTIVSLEDYEEAETRQKMESDLGVIIGLDPSRSGEDSSVICARQGRNLLNISEITCKRDSVDLADFAIKYYGQYQGSVIAIDVGGLGGPIADMLKRRLSPGAVIEVNFGGRSSNPARYVNKRAEIWERYGEWIKTSSIPKNESLKRDSVNIEGWWTGKGDKFQAESKEDYKSRTGLPSCDWADSVVCTMGIEAPKKRSSSGSVESIIARQRLAARGATLL